ncbi:hypothetical protein KIN20_038304, partial [Parelaphostrongylus tenuis]
NRDINLSEILLEAHETLGEAGERLGTRNIGAAVLTGGRLEKLTESVELDEEEYERIRCAGGTVDEVYYQKDVSKNTNNLINGSTMNSRQLGFYSLHPVLTPKPIEKSLPITNEMDYVIIGSWALWEFLSDTQIASILGSSVNPQLAAKIIQDSLQACDFNGNSCVMVIRLLKPELSFRSTSNESRWLLRSSAPMAIPPMRVEQKNQGDDLRNIGHRLEKINEVITKMEDETAGHNTGYVSGRQLYNRIVAHEKVSNWIASPSSSSATPPPDPASSCYTQFMSELKTKVSRLDFNSPIQDENEAAVAVERHQHNQENNSNVQDDKIIIPLCKHTKGRMFSTVQFCHLRYKLIH